MTDPSPPLEDYPTLEATACHRYYVLNEVSGSGLAMFIKMQSLERRLLFARYILRRVQNGYMRDAQRNMPIDTALRKTATTY